ncbi:unnamed protein product [Rotaria magnacalcarata]|uniref:Uncharacterized protein n=3 Tax=Rotaria magnacalcarata TaxID=392030 RepID=A0A816TXM8_9BILA|nr:unnamed protein product [Rotaria magnacalcarata]
MACLVHDRQFLAEFHAAINQIRLTKEFTVSTLQKLSKRCCSCPNRRNNIPSLTIGLPLTSLDINQLRFICLQLDLEQNAANYVRSLPSKIVHYTVLSSLTLLDSKMEAMLLNQFFVQQSSQLDAIQRMHHVSLEFVTSTTSKDLLNEIAHIKCDLVAKCSNYFQAIQAINGIWIIISIEDQSRVDIVKHVLQQQWLRFMHDKHTSITWQEKVPSKIDNNKFWNKNRSANRHQKPHTKCASQLCKPVQTMSISEEDRNELEDSRDTKIEYSNGEILLVNNPRFKFLINPYEFSSKRRQSRMHRRQHILTSALITSVACHVK